MASKKTPAAKKPAAAKPAAPKRPAANGAETKAEAKPVSAATPVKPAAAAAPVDAKIAAAFAGSSDAVCSNLAALRAALAGEKAREGASERKKIATDLEALELDYRNRGS